MKTSKGKAKLRLAEDAPPPHSPTEPPPAASSPPTTGKALAGRGKGFARRIYRLRTMGCAIGFFCVAGVFRQLHAAPWLWALLVFHGYLCGRTSLIALRCAPACPIGASAAI
ncbi:hypothetical protein [Pandoraea sp.]|uniref:hypothetical protein n=1 Tax=Pandoraea sp. TaxID=1883445 RepID=UPI0025F4EC0A|nr:hypothetical protein [Pandoraea sp.]